MRRTHFLLGGSAVAIASTTTIAGAQILGGFRQQYTVAVSVPLSGDAMRSGEQIADGVRAAINEANNLSGPLGTAFGLRTFDDQNALATAFTNAEFAADDPSIVATIGEFDSTVTLGSLPQYANKQMPLIVPTGTLDEITQRGYRNVFRLPVKDSTEGRFFAQYLSRERHPKLAMAVTQDGDYGTGVAQGFVDGAKVEKMTADGYVFPYVKPDFAAAAKAIIAKSPDFIYLCGKTGDMGPLVATLRAGGYAGSFGASEGFYNIATMQQYGALLEGAVFSSSLPPLDRAPSIFTELADLRGRLGQVSGLSAFGYAAAQIVMQAARRTGATNRLAMLSTLRNGGSYATLVGNYSFDANGDPIDPNVYFYTIAGGKFKFLKPSKPNGFIL